MTGEFFTENEIKACIFDNDGTIVDSIQIYWDVMEELAGTKVSQEFKSSLNGYSDIDVARAMVKKFNMTITPEQYLELRDPIVNEKLKQTPLVKGVANIITKLHDMKIPIAIATSGLKDTLEIKFTQHPEIRKLFDIVVSKDDVQATKPDPALFNCAFKKFNLDIKPENVLVFEDAYAGVLAARRAGMNVVMLHADGSDKEAKSKEIGTFPTQFVEDWDDFDFSKYHWFSK